MKRRRGYPLGAPRQVVVDCARGALNYRAIVGCSHRSLFVGIPEVLARKKRLDPKRLNAVLFGPNGIVRGPA